MSEPKIADNKPLVLDLEPGTYHWCACGLSTKGGFCDGSHRPTDMRPVKFEVGEKQTVAICMCKHTEDAPYCDGSHTKL